MTQDDHIFISYKRENSTTANQVRMALKSLDLEIWWDEKLQTGQHWEEEIDGALLSAAVVLVLWSSRSVSSDWVKQEASYAKINQNLVHARIDDCAIPSQFASLMAADLRSWNQREDAPEFTQMAQEIRRVMEKSIVSGGKPQHFVARTESTNSKKNHSDKMYIVTLARVFLTGLMLGLIAFPIGSFALKKLNRSTSNAPPEIARNANGDVAPELMLEDLMQEEMLSWRRVSGRIRNTGSGAFTDVVLGVEWLDDKGSVLDTNSKSVVWRDDLRAGAAISFTIDVDNDHRFSSYKLFVVKAVQKP